MGKSPEDIKKIRKYASGLLHYRKLKGRFSMKDRLLAHYLELSSERCTENLAKAAQIDDYQVVKIQADSPPETHVKEHL